MGSFVSGLLQNVLESLLGKGIEEAGGLARYRTVRGICVILMLLAAGWIAIASALLWTSTRVPGVSGLVAYVQAGGPVWLLVVPVAAVLTFVLALLPAHGKCTLAAYASIVVFALALGGLASFQGGKYDVNAAAVSCVIIAIPLPLLGLMLGMTEHVPLDAPLARIALVYWGRYRHLLALRTFGSERNLRVSGPGGSENALTLEGFYDAQHPITITSGASFKLSSEQSATYTLSVKMGSPADIVAFRISYQPPPKKMRGHVVPGVSRTRRALPLHFYVVPAQATYLPPDFIARMMPLVEAGRPFLAKSDFVHATPFGIRWTHKSYYRLTRKDAQLEPVAHWMLQLVAALEPFSPHPTPAPMSPSPAVPAAPQQVYGEQYTRQAW